MSGGSAGPVRPLVGVRVVDLTVERGELAGRLLSDLGAEVIKVESPDGSAGRRLPPLDPTDAGHSLFFTMRNCGKRSVVLDLTSDCGNAVGGDDGDNDGMDGAAVGDWGWFESLLASADVLLDSAEPGAHAARGLGGLEADEVVKRHPHLITASITAYGRSGPYAGRDVPGSVVDATSGMCWKAGLPEREPLFPPGDISGDAAGLMTAFAVVCALIQRHGDARNNAADRAGSDRASGGQMTGAGQLIDVSANEAAAQITDWSITNAARNIAQGKDPVEIRAGAGPIYTIIATKDGFVRLVVISLRHWQAIRAWLGEPEVLQDPKFDSFLERMMVADSIITPLYEEFFADMTMQEVSEEAQRRGIVATPILKPADVLTCEHFESRKTFDKVPLGNKVPLGDSESSGDERVMCLPSGWMEIDGIRLGPTGRPPQLGEHTEQVLSELAMTSDLSPINVSAATSTVTPASSSVNDSSSTTPSIPIASDAVDPVTSTASADAFPLDGIRVADFGHGGVGVEIGRMLADYGADVVKVESRSHPDFVRVVLGAEMSPSFASSSRSKRCFGVNLKTPEGRDLVLDWIGTGVDVAIENSSTGTMDRLGLSYDALSEANPELVMVSSQLMGSTGPWANWSGYGPNSQVTGAMTHLWDYPDMERPSGSQTIFPDHWAGRMGALGVVAALYGQRSGVLDKGCHIEVCQAEQTIGVMGDLLAAESLQAGSALPQGNRRDRGVPWGIFACEGDDQWVAICCRNDDEWRALAELMASDGESGLVGEDIDSLIELAARWDRIDEIEAVVSTWTQSRSKYEVTVACLAVGVPAGPMLTSKEQLQDEHLKARGFLVNMEQPPYGDLIVEGPAFHASGMKTPEARPAPALGEHTIEIVAKLGLDADTVDVLATTGTLDLPTP